MLISFVSIKYNSPERNYRVFSRQFNPQEPPEIQDFFIQIGTYNSFQEAMGMVKIKSRQLPYIPADMGALACTSYKNGTYNIVQLQDPTAEFSIVGETFNSLASAEEVARKLGPLWAQVFIRSPTTPTRSLNGTSDLTRPNGDTLARSASQ